MPQLYDNAPSVTGYVSSSTDPQVSSLNATEREKLEKSLHHLSGRIQALKARLDPVLKPVLPVLPAADAKGQAQQIPPTASPLTDGLRAYQRIVLGALEDVEDALNRLDL